MSYTDGSAVLVRSKRLIFLAFVLSGCKSPEADSANLQGTWEVKEVRGEFWFGLNLYRMEDSERITFDGDKCVIFTKNSPPHKRKHGTFKLDATASPKRIDFVIKEKPVLAIYSLYGNRLTLCIGKTDNERPTVFQSGEWNRPTLIMLKRLTQPEQD